MEDYNIYAERCINLYKKICINNKMDVGHDVEHVIKVAKTGNDALEEYIAMKPGPLPNNIKLRINMACLLHEIGDKKFYDVTQCDTYTYRKQIISEILHDYDRFTKELCDDIILMIDLCSARKWGNKYPSNINVYHLIPRWSDRLEATGYIGIARCLLYSFNKNNLLCQDTDNFPTTLQELNTIAPRSRFDTYTLRNGISVDAWEHFQDKVRHIDGFGVPIKSLKKKLDIGKTIIDKFILDFVANNKKYDIEWLISKCEKDYANIVNELRIMSTILKSANNKWIK